MPAQNVMQQGPAVAPQCCSLPQLRDVEDRATTKPGLGQSQVCRGSLMASVAELRHVARGDAAAVHLWRPGYHSVGQCQETTGRLGARAETLVLYCCSCWAALF